MIAGFSAPNAGIHPPAPRYHASISQITRLKDTMARVGWNDLLGGVLIGITTPDLNHKTIGIAEVRTVSTLLRVQILSP